MTIYEATKNSQNQRAIWNKDQEGAAVARAKSQASQLQVSLSDKGTSASSRLLFVGSQYSAVLLVRLGCARGAVTEAVLSTMTRTTTRVGLRWSTCWLPSPA